MYEGLSVFYNTLTYDINYKALAKFVDGAVRRSFAWKEYKQRGETPILLDAGAGTGSFVCLMTEKYDCIGLDISEEMLDIARCRPGGGNVLWICQDMCKMDLFGSVTAVVSLTDSVNHLLTEKRLSSFFRRAHNFLDPGGLLIFDVLTEDHFTRDGASMDYFADLEEESCFWAGKYSPGTGICTYNVSCFKLIDPANGIYERSDDTVKEKIWSGETLRRLLEDAGFVSVRCMAGGEKGAPGGKTGKDRLYFICEKEH